MAPSLLDDDVMVSRTRLISLVLTVSLVASAGQAQSPPPSAHPRGPAVLTPDQLDQLLAPIALHPDPLVGQILIAPTYPLEMVQDTPAGVQEILHRRVGRNELNVIEVCRAFVVAQREYAARDPMSTGLAEFPQHAGDPRRPVLAAARS